MIYRSDYAAEYLLTVLVKLARGGYFSWRIIYQVNRRPLKFARTKVWFPLSLYLSRNDVMLCRQSKGLYRQCNSSHLDRR